MKRLLALSALLLSSVAASANPVPLRFVSYDGPFVNGIPTYPYTLSLELGPGMDFQVMCDDYYHGGAPGDRWNANITNLGTGNLSLVRFASFGLDAYQEAGWILIQTFVTPPSQWPDMNFAVWHIFNPTVPINSQAQYWIDLAILMHGGVDYSEVWIATPVNIQAPPDQDQEFLFIAKDFNPPTPTTPEPASLLLLTSGLAAIASRMCRRR